MTDRKVALVIGNGAYAHASQLDAPRRDAIRMASLLEGIGFSVVTGFDCDYVQFRDRARDFLDRLDPQALGLFYFSGHGAQGMDGGNHMLPVDARLVDPEDLGRVTMPLDDLLARMRGKARVSLILLDACRDDPFDEMARATGTKSVFAGRPGLAAVPRAALGQALIGFAAEEGHIALDAGSGQPSPFTAALVRHLATPGRDIRDILGDVRRDVFAATDGRQTPWTKEALTDEVVLVPGPVAGAAPRQGLHAPAAPWVEPPAPAVDPKRESAAPDARSRRPLVAAALVAFVLVSGVVLAARPALVCALPGTAALGACQATAIDLVPLIRRLDSEDRAVRLDAQMRLSDAFNTRPIAADEQRRLTQELLFAASLDRMLGLGRDGRYGLVFVLAEIPAATWARRDWAALLKDATSLYDELDGAVKSGRLEIPVVRQSHLERFGQNIGAVRTGTVPGTLIDRTIPLLRTPDTSLVRPTPSE
jgi:hypothetical protein